MSGNGGRARLRILGVCLASLLPVAVWAAATAGGGAPAAMVAVSGAGATAGGSSARADVNGEAAPASPVTTGPATNPTNGASRPAAATASAPPVTSPSRPQAEPPVTTAPATVPGPSTTSTTLPGLLSILNPPVNNWSAVTGAMNTRLRMEPATPLPGQAVRFEVEVMAASPCCTINLSYGDEVVNASSPGGCVSATTRTATFTHTFTTAGNYELFLLASTLPCTATTVEGPPVAPDINSGQIKACITVGLRLLGPPSCEPFNHFGPGTVIG